MIPDDWLILVLSIPGQRGSDRVRIWRALKALGTAVLRDGVYLAPASREIQAALETQRAAVRDVGGSAYLFRHRTAPGDGDNAGFRALFDRGEEYADLMARVSYLRDMLGDLTEAEARRRETQLKRDYENLRSIDFFADDRQEAAAAAIAALAQALDARFSPDEPKASDRGLSRLRASDYRGRLWATREHLWIDRAASAWLIKRFIDPQARFLWLKDPSECPDEAVGFDFDGAEFSHVGNRVTFESLLYCFELDDNSTLARIGSLVNFLDVGGVPVAEARGFATLMAGAKQRAANDDELLHDAGMMLDFLYDAYAEAHGGRQKDE